MYEGYFLNGFPEGNGTLYSEDCTHIITGNFKEGKLHGEIKILDKKENNTEIKCYYHGIESKTKKQLC